LPFLVFYFASFSAGVDENAGLLEACDCLAESNGAHLADAGGEDKCFNANKEGVVNAEVTITDSEFH
jgi:hypothetical protein